MAQDTIKITILEDGTIKTETDSVSAANHSNAEAFIRDIHRLAGGVVKRVMRLAHSLHGALRAHTHDGHTHDH